MGLGGSVWVHIEGIRRCTVDLDIDNPKYKKRVEDVSLKMGSGLWKGLEKYKVQKLSKTYMSSGYQPRVPKSLVGHA